MHQSCLQSVIDDRILTPSEYPMMQSVTRNVEREMLWFLAEAVTVLKLSGSVIGCAAITRNVRIQVENDTTVEIHVLKSIRLYQ